MGLPSHHEALAPMLILVLEAPRIFPDKIADSGLYKVAYES